MNKDYFRNGTLNQAVIIKGNHWFNTWRSLRGRRRLRRATRRAVTQLRSSQPAWVESLFDSHFLLNQGMPILERHMACPASTDAFDLVLAWAEQWPSMTAAQRKSNLQQLTPVAAMFLRLLEKEMRRKHDYNTDKITSPARRWDT